MSINYAKIKLPIGGIYAAASGKGVAAISLRPRSEDLFVGWCVRALGETPVPGGGFMLDTLRAELDAYFSGRLKKFKVPLDLRGTEFQLAVWRELLRVPFGEVVTYGELARMMGRPGASRAVGGAMNQNRVPIIVPCHRVVASGGGLGGYGSGVDIKRKLLELEGIRF